MKKLVISLLVFLLAAPVIAKPVTLQKDRAIFVQSATTAEIEELFNKYNYTDVAQMELAVPRIYIRHLPSDWDKDPSTEEKNRLFIRMLLPLVLKVNEEITAERNEIEKIAADRQAKSDLSDKQKQRLNELAQKYDVFTPLSDATRWPVLIKRLLTKVDVVPPSIMLATASIYTEWGHSRLAKQANSLYLDEVWYTNNGIKPADDKEAEYRYKTYDSLEDSIAARALKFNTHINYEYFREMRRLQREVDQKPYGPQMATTMYHDSNLRNIAGLIDFTLSFYGLNNTDIAPHLYDLP